MHAKLSGETNSCHSLLLPNVVYITQTLIEPLPLSNAQAVEHEDQGEQQLGHVVPVHDGLPPASTRCKRGVFQATQIQIQFKYTNRI